MPQREENQAKATPGKNVALSSDLLRLLTLPFPSFYLRLLPPLLSETHFSLRSPFIFGRLLATPSSACIPRSEQPSAHLIPEENARALYDKCMREERREISSCVLDRMHNGFHRAGVNTTANKPGVKCAFFHSANPILKLC